MFNHINRTLWAEFAAGVRDTIPLLLGAAPFGVIFGALAITSGVNWWAAQGMSLFVFAGSSQFIAVGLIDQGVGLLLIVLTTLIVNLRHALYSMSLGPYLKNLPQRWLLPLGFWLTDETYAVTIRRFTSIEPSPHKHWYMLGSSVAMYTNWQLCTLIGILIGSQVEDAKTWGLDFAMVVTFIGIVVPMIRSYPMLISALSAAISALLLNGIPNHLGLFAASVIGIGAGAISERWNSQRQPVAEEIAP
ncbi:MAG: AzlC family ABC transporter permease [Chloroflexi bacterium]|nr:AzlC family ABC transporter permease [Chloroflexota bacterium]